MSESLLQRICDHMERISDQLGVLITLHEGQERVPRLRAADIPALEHLLPRIWGVNGIGQFTVSELRDKAKTDKELSDAIVHVAGDSTKRLGRLLQRGSEAGFITSRPRQSGISIHKVSKESGAVIWGLGYTPPDESESSSNGFQNPE